ncbi:LysR substrate-binding domain-containing protein [Inhella sp.]|uniref:LysR substrate-binding domain-containing protein n=1 Tax=Inhella sp. TaxID=1921806 RepID=UPI0035B39D94
MPAPVRLPSIDALRAFEAAARLGTFERAAEELAVTASAVSKRVAALEDQLGLLLLQRTGKALLLSPEGRDYLEPVRAVLDQLQAMPQHRREPSPRARLRVLAPPTFARQVLVPLLPEFLAQHPRLDLDLAVSVPGAEPDLLAVADLRIVHGELAHLRHRGALTLMDDVVTPVASPDLAGPPLASPAELAHWPLLRTPLEPWAPWFAAAGRPGLEPTEGPRFFDLGLTLEAAVTGQGVALARPSLARRWLASGELRPLFALTVKPLRQYLLLPSSGSADSPEAEAAIAAFSTWLPQRARAWAQQAQELLSAQA